MAAFTEGAIQFEQECPDAFAVSGCDVSSFSQDTAIAMDILAEVMRFRRTSGSQTPCPTSPCPKCSEPHLSKIVSAVAQRRPVTFVLPAFPGKSPNPAKVLGPLPDMA